MCFKTWLDNFFEIVRVYKKFYFTKLYRSGWKAFFLHSRAITVFPFFKNLPFLCSSSFLQALYLLEEAQYHHHIAAARPIWSNVAVLNLQRQAPAGSSSSPTSTTQTKPRKGKSNAWAFFTKRQTLYSQVNSKWPMLSKDSLLENRLFDFLLEYQRYSRLHELYHNLRAYATKFIST